MMMIMVVVVVVVVAVVVVLSLLARHPLGVAYDIHILALPVGTGCAVSSVCESCPIILVLDCPLVTDHLFNWPLCVVCMLLYVRTPFFSVADRFLNLSFYLP